MIATLQVLLILLFPALSIWLNHKYKFASILSPVVLCYLFGMLLPNLFRFPIITDISSAATEGTVLLGIPMLLLTTDFIKWLRLAKATVISFGLAILSALIASSVVSLIFASRVANSDKIAGMLVGVYTGGTPNMSAIGLALGVPEATFLILNGVDFLCGGVYFLILLSVVKPVLTLFLPPFKSAEGNTDGEEDVFNPESKSGRLFPNGIRKQAIDSGASLALSIAFALAAVGLSLLIFSEMNIALIILTVTTLGIAASFMSKIRKLEGSYSTGQYLLLMFCVAIGTLADLREIADTGGIMLLYVASVMALAITLHFASAALFRIDRDTVIITHTAGIYGPAFIGPVADMLDNREVMVSGLTTSLVGLAAGNYLGIGLAYLLKNLL